MDGFSSGCALLLLLSLEGLDLVAACLTATVADSGVTVAPSSELCLVFEPPSFAVLAALWSAEASRERASERDRTSSPRAVASSPRRTDAEVGWAAELAGAGPLSAGRLESSSALKSSFRGDGSDRTGFDCAA